MCGLTVYLLTHTHPHVASFPQVLQGLLAPLLLAASVAVGGTVQPSGQCTSEMNKIKDLLEVSCVEVGLAGIPSELPKETGILLLASNQLAKVALAAFRHLPQLSELDLSNNSLRALETGPALPKLEQLLLSHNGLESLPAFPGLPSLWRLALGHNQLSQLPAGGFRELGQLRELELQGNRLPSLPAGAFEGLLMLKDLDLSDNRLEVLPAELLAKLPKLEILGLERNRLERVPDGFFADNEYAYVYLADNPWVCDCRLDYLRRWIQENEFFVYTRTVVQEGGLDKEVTENEPQRVLCQSPPEEKGQPVMAFTAECSSLGELDWEEGGEGGPAGESSTPMAAPPSPAASWQSPSTAISPAGAALTTTTSIASAPGPTTAHSPATTTPGPTTALRALTTTAALGTSGLSTSCATAGRSTGRSSGPMTTPGPSTSHSPTPSDPTTMATSGIPPALSPTASMPPTSLPPSAPPPTSMLHSLLPPSAPPPTPAVPEHPLSPAALVPSASTHAKSSPRMSAPLPTREFSTPPPSEPSAHCLCPVLPIRVLGVAAHQGSKVDWLSASCCLLRLALYLACLALVALPTLALLCLLGCLCHLGWYRQAVPGALGSRLSSRQHWQRASPEGWQATSAEAPRPLSGSRIYRVCKKFQLGPSRHVSWLLVSLPGPARKWAQMQARLSSYSLDGGREALGAVRVKYAAASL